MEPLDNLFSSPEKAKSTKSVRNTARKNASAMVNATMSDEEDMDIGNSQWRLELGKRRC